MSDVALNSLRYNDTNTRRSDPPNRHHGELEIIADKAFLNFDCSGFVCHVLIESGYRIDYHSTGAFLTSKGFSTVPPEEVQAGDIILFGGHVGIVIEYANSTHLGRFIHMHGKDDVGGIKISEFVSVKSTDSNNRYYGTRRAIKGFRRVKKERYSGTVDLHINNSNPTPTLRPLGTMVYSNYVRKTSKPAKTALLDKTGHLPAKKPLKLKSVPPDKGLTGLIARLYSHLPSFKATSHRTRRRGIE